MGIIELLLVSVALAMDAFAVSICKGVKMTSIKKLQVVIIALFFGVFQMLMPILGWLVGMKFESYIKEFDHWIAFILLSILGIKMIIETFKKTDDEVKNHFDLKELFVLAIATSIDALAVGITLAFLDINIFLASLTIGLVTFVLCVIGVLIGKFVRGKLNNKAELLGGIILILIGTKILLEHLGIINF